LLSKLTPFNFMILSSVVKELEINTDTSTTRDSSVIADEATR
jgi:hypothetical protein